MVGDIAAALYSVDGDAGVTELIIGGKDVRRVRVATESDGWFMLQQKKHVSDALVPPRLNQRMLELPYTQIWFASQIED